MVHGPRTGTNNQKKDIIAAAMHSRQFCPGILSATWTNLISRAFVVLLMLLQPEVGPDPVAAIPWRGLARRLAPSQPRKPTPIPISYRLDAWSQYDNPEEGTAREGDISELPLSRKTTARDPNLLWTGGIVRYFVDESILKEPAKLAVLEDAMDTIMEKTCIRFIRIFPYKNGSFPINGWVNITGGQKGCFSDLGRSPIGPSNLNLDVNRCFRTRGHALHEILHTLGVYHEHMRPDREEYINILWDNIKEGDAFNFRIMDEEVVTNYGLPYDYDSIMHYSMTAFSKDKSIPTIVPTKRDVEIGQRNHLSFYDIQKLLITYKCSNINTDMLYAEMARDHRDHLELLNLNSTALAMKVTKTPSFDSFDTFDDYNQIQSDITGNNWDSFDYFYPNPQQYDRRMNGPIYPDYFYFL